MNMLEHETTNSKSFISANIVSFGELISASEATDKKIRDYVIPGYQRPYEWDKEQIEKVFASIKNNMANGDPLLLGTIQLNKSSDCFEIIDGQQRLTTLWLMHCILRSDADKSRYRFDPKNEINPQYAEAMRAVVEGSESTAITSQYLDNFNYIYMLIESSKDKGNSSNDDLCRYILDNVIFVEIITDFTVQTTTDGKSHNRSIERTIQIFDSLNTTGLPLDTKDIFKIKYRDYLVMNNPGADQNDLDNLFVRINKAYSTVLSCESELGSIYALNEDDLLDAYRFYLMIYSDAAAATGFKQSNHAYFEDLFSKADVEPSPNIDDLTNLAEVMYCAQKKMKERDVDKRGNILLNCAKELFSWSGYGRLKNLFFTLIYARVHKNTKSSGNEAFRKNLTDNIDAYIEDSLKVMELLWKACSIMHSTIGQVVNAMYNAIGQVVKKYTEENGLDNSVIEGMLREPIEAWNDRTKGFIGMFSPEYNIFSNTRSSLFVALSYIQDCCDKCNCDITAASVKDVLFYHSDSKTRVEIEHIASHALYSEEIFVNCIGNLMFLQRNINRRLGRATAKVIHAPDGRNTDYQNKRDEYSAAELACTILLTKKLDTDKDIQEVIRVRNEEKASYIMNLYECVLPQNS